MYGNRGSATLVRFIGSKSGCCGIENRPISWRPSSAKSHSLIKTSPIRRAIAVCHLATIFSLFTACGATLGSIDERARGFNQETADYANVASLFNIVRASQNEPLNFVAVTGNTGHDTLTGALGLPNVSFFVGPDRPAVDRLFGFVTTGSSIGGSVSNDFQFSVIDDPSSAAALLRPLDPAALAFFINQGYDRDLLFFLFVQEIDVFNSNFREPQQPYSNDPFPSGSTSVSPKYRRTYDLLMNYLQSEGLTAVADQGLVPSGTSSNGLGYFCFDRRLITSGISPIGPNFADVGCYPGPQKPPSGKNTNVHKFKLPNLTTSYQASRDDDNANSPASAATTHILNCFSPSEEDKKRGITKSYPANAWTFCDPENNIVILRTRSLQGAYRFLGELLVVDDYKLNSYMPPSRLFSLEENKDNIFYVTHSEENCFTKMEYDGNMWCVPGMAHTTKRVFTLLHQLFELFAQPSNQPTTPTVRLTG